MYTCVLLWAISYRFNPAKGQGLPPQVTTILAQGKSGPCSFVFWGVTTF